MKRSGKFLTVLLVVLMTAGVPATTFGAYQEPTEGSDMEAYTLFMKADEHWASYDSCGMKGTVTVALTTSIMEEYETQSSVMTLDLVIEKPDQIYLEMGLVTDTQVEKAQFLFNGETAYTRTADDEQEYTQWVSSDEGLDDVLMGGGMLPQAMALGIKSETTKDTYSFGQDELIDGVLYKQVIVQKDPAFLQGISDDLVEIVMESADTGSMSEGDRAIMSVFITELLQSLDADLSTSYLIDENTLKIYSVTMNGIYKMNLMGIRMQEDINGSFSYYGYGEPISIPVVKETDIQK